MNQVTQAEFARMCGVSRKTVTKWKGDGRLKMVGDLVDVEASKAFMERYRRDGVPQPLRDKAEAAGPGSVEDAGPPSGMTVGEAAKRLAELDWQVSFDWGPAAVRKRIRDAADALDLELAQSDEQPPIHWGGWQVRLKGAGAMGEDMSREHITAGFGFELDEVDVLFKCRQDLLGAPHEPEHPDTPVRISEAQLRLLAFPFSAKHRRSDDAAHPFPNTNPAAS